MGEDGGTPGRLHSEGSWPARVGERVVRKLVLNAIKWAASPEALAWRRQSEAYFQVLHKLGVWNEANFRQGQLLRLRRSLHVCCPLSRDKLLRVVRGRASDRSGPAPARGGFRGRRQSEVLLITKGHAFDREPFFQLFDHPPVARPRDGRTRAACAELFFVQRWRKSTTCSCLRPQRKQADRRHPRVDKAGKPGAKQRRQSGIHVEPSTAIWGRIEALLRQGKPVIFLHMRPHRGSTLAEFTEVMGIACDWGQPLRVRGVDHPKSGFPDTKHASRWSTRRTLSLKGWRWLRNRDEAYNCPSSRTRCIRCCAPISCRKTSN